MAKRFIECISNFLIDIDDSDGIIHIELDKFYFETLGIFKMLVNENAPDILQLCQTSQNLTYIENSINFFQNYIESELNFPCVKDYESMLYYEQMKIKCEEMMHERLQNKIDAMLNYSQIDWCPKNLNNQHNEFLQSLMDYLRGVLIAMQEIYPEFVSSLIYLAFKYINNKIIFDFFESSKSYNIIGLANLQIDINFIFKICKNYFGEYANLSECLQQIKQFLDLFLVGNPNEIADYKIKEEKYYRLEIKKIVTIFDRYKKIKHSKLPYIRKRHLKAIQEKLKLDIKMDIL